MLSLVNSLKHSSKQIVSSLSLKPITSLSPSINYLINVKDARNFHLSTKKLGGDNQEFIVSALGSRFYKFFY